MAEQRWQVTIVRRDGPVLDTLLDDVIAGCSLASAVDRAWDRMTDEQRVAANWIDARVAVSDEELEVFLGGPR